MSHEHGTHGGDATESQSGAIRRGHTHHHGTGRAFAIGVGLNACFVVAELIAGLAAHSVALVADSAHNFLVT